MNHPLPMDHSLSIDLHSVEKSFRAGSTVTTVLRKVDFVARRGEMIFLTGPSGSGKTTLLSILCGTLKADAGEIGVLGEPLHLLGEKHITRFRAQHVGFIFQQFNLIPTLTIEDNVSVPLLIQGRCRDIALGKAREVLALVGLADKFAETPSRLSGGQQQRVAIARALVHDPDLLVCDEPTSALDSENGHRVMELLKQVAKDPRRTVVVVTHDHRTYGYADRMAEMEDGRIHRTLQSPAEITQAHGSN